MKRILIADDSFFMRTVMRKFLQNHDYTIVGEAENGRIAIEMYKKLSPDITTLDITMNEMTGIEALREIIKYDKNAKVIMVSSLGQESFVRETIMLGAKNFIVKPLSEEMIISALSKL